MSDAAPPFEPSKHLRKMRGGADYLEVRWRIVWFRDKFPAGDISTEHIQIGESHAIFRAIVIAITEGGEICGRATGYGSETAKDFGDFIEKAETKAVGRALAALGFGTQFANDLDEGERIADAPAEGRSAQQHRQPAPQQIRQQPQSAQPEPATLITDAGRRRLEAIARERGLTHDDWKAIAIGWFEVESTKDLRFDQADKLERFIEGATAEVLSRSLEKVGVTWPRTPNTAPATAEEVNAFLAGHEPGPNPDRWTS